MPTSLSSTKTAVVFTILVCIVLLIATAIRVVGTIQRSVYDGQHQFILLLQAANNRAVLASFDPVNDVAVILYITNPHKLSIQQALAIGVDGHMHISGFLSNEKQIESALLGSTLHPDQRENSITWYDSLRLYWLLHTMNGAQVQESSVTLPADANAVVKTDQAFLDSTLQKEDFSIQVINASNTTGLAARLGALLTNSGFSVIDVRTDQVATTSSVIRYTGSMSYTLIKLKRILAFPVQMTDDQMIANIQIIIGGDRSQTSRF